MSTPSSKKHSAAYKLFHYRFSISVSAIHLMSEKVLEEYGFATTENRDYDAGLAGASTEASMTIAAIAVLRSEGASVRLMMPEQAVSIYGYITEHLRDWENEIRNGFGGRDVPIDDLIVFDNLATDVWTVARSFVGKDKMDNGVGRRLREFGSRPFSRTMPMAAPVKEKATEHVSRIGVITQNMNVDTAKWR